MNLPRPNELAPAELPHRIQRSRAAMATVFEVLLVGDDVEHLAATAEAALDEIQRIARRFNRHDPQSEVARINRAAAAGPVQVDHELAWLLALGQSAFDLTSGAFDLACGRGAGAPPGSWREVRFDPSARTIAFTSERPQLDFGAIGKGYALDRAAELVREQGITIGLLHGGTSSVLALESDSSAAAGWPIELADPWSAAAAIGSVALRQQALSCSFVFPSAQEHASDLIDPRTGDVLAAQAGCVALASSATEAEILSTAVLCLGASAARDWLRRAAIEGQVGWMHPPEGNPRLEWLR